MPVHQTPGYRLSNQWGTDIFIRNIYGAFFNHIFFATRPDIWVYVGAALVVGSGLIIWWREKQNNPQDT